MTVCDGIKGRIVIFLTRPGKGKPLRFMVSGFCGDEIRMTVALI